MNETNTLYAIRSEFLCASAAADTMDKFKSSCQLLRTEYAVESYEMMKKLDDKDFCKVVSTIWAMLCTNKYHQNNVPSLRVL